MQMQSLMRWKSLCLQMMLAMTCAVFVHCSTNIRCVVVGVVVVVIGVVVLIVVVVVVVIVMMLVIVIACAV